MADHFIAMNPDNPPPTEEKSITSLSKERRPIRSDQREHTSFGKTKGVVSNVPSAHILRPENNRKAPEETLTTVEKTFLATGEPINPGDTFMGKTLRHRSAGPSEAPPPEIRYTSDVQILPAAAGPPVNNDSHAVIHHRVSPYPFQPPARVEHGAGSTHSNEESVRLGARVMTTPQIANTGAQMTRHLQGGVENSDVTFGGGGSAGVVNNSDVTYGSGKPVINPNTDLSIGGGGTVDRQVREDEIHTGGVGEPIKV
jgi:hypothetical protein